MQKGFEGLTVTFFCTLPIKRFCLWSVCAKNCDGLPVATCLEGKNLRLCDTSREQHMALLKSVIHRQKIHPHPNPFSISGFRRLFPEPEQVFLLLKVLLPGLPSEGVCRPRSGQILLNFRAENCVSTARTSKGITALEFTDSIPAIPPCSDTDR